MTNWKSLDDMWAGLRGVIETADGKVQVVDEGKLRGAGVDALAWHAALSDDEGVRDTARWAIRAAARALGIESASIFPLYEARGRKKCGGFTVPAINVRGMTYDTTRAALRAALRNDVAAVIFEIAKSEIGYTNQRPAEYAAVVLAAAIKEGWKGPMFIQGDHYQLNMAKFKEDPEKEKKIIADLVKESIAAGFLNIDVDSSTLVDLSHATVREQQRDNFEVCGELTRVVRENEPEGVTVAVGGEIGEVGKKNSTEEELREFMNGYLETLGRGSVGIDRISSQTGTSHGGVPLPDGSVAQVKLDFDCLSRLSRVSVEEFGMAGSRHRFPEHHLRQPAFPRRAEAGDVCLSPRHLRRRAEGGADRGAVPLQDPEEGPRPLQAAALEPAAGHPREDRRGARTEVRVPLPSAEGHEDGGTRRADHPAGGGSVPEAEGLNRTLASPAGRDAPSGRLPAVP
jgi:hypothetical protein